MKLSEALTIVLDLARGDELEYDNERLQEAIDMVEEHQEEVEASEGPLIITQHMIIDVPDGVNIRVAGQEDD